MPEKSIASASSGTALNQILSVSALARSVRDTLERRFPLLWVSGEISNLRPAASGHWYFVLKDAHAQVRCVMFRNRNRLLDWPLREGMQVELQGLVTLYEARGDFQITVENLRRSGQGALYEAFLRLKESLQRQGLFDAAIKRPLPSNPQRIGVITSLGAAALRDVLSTLARRNPSIAVIVYPTAVQGTGAAQEIARAITVAGQRSECDVLILCRGGGSIEDLWSFNEEVVARAIRDCSLPIITGVGHETDFTIADFAADQRAPTPTAAAELAAPARIPLLRQVRELSNRVMRQQARTLLDAAQRMDHLARRLVHPGRKLTVQWQTLQTLQQRLIRSSQQSLQSQQWQLQQLSQRLRARPVPLDDYQRRLSTLQHRMQTTHNNRLQLLRQRMDALGESLNHLDPLRVLDRGYAMVTDAHGAVLRHAHQAELGTQITITLANGQLGAKVNQLYPTKKAQPTTQEQ
jgi:exodeoxyribonuclease VII large subunit